MLARWELPQTDGSERAPRPHRPRVAVAGLVVAIAAATALTWLFIRDRGERQQAGEPIAASSTTPAKASVSDPRSDAGDRTAPSGMPGEPASNSLELPEATPEALRASALAAVQRLIDDLPQRPEPVALMALARKRFGQHEAAIECWQRCLELDARFADAYHGLGTIALERGKHAEAEAFIRRGLALRPDLPEARIVLADALLGQGKHEEAVTVLEEEVGQFPPRASTVFRLGQTYAQLGRHAEARRSLEQAVELDPAAAYPYFALATVCTRLDEKEAAAQYRAQFAERKEQALQAERERLKQFDDLQEMRSSAAFFHTAAGMIYLRNAQPDKAERLWRLAAAIDPKDQDARMRLVEVYEKSGRRDEALTALEELRQIDPHNALYTVNLAMLRASRQQLGAAETVLQEGIQRDPDAAILHAALAQLYLRSGREYTRARDLAQAAVARQPSAANYALLAAACQQLGDIPAAQVAVERALAMEPQNTELQAFARRLKQPPASGPNGTTAADRTKAE